MKGGVLPDRRRRFLLNFLWLSLSAAVVLADHATGPLLRLRILQIVPVALAARFSGRTVGVALACSLPAAEAWLATLGAAPWSWVTALANAGIQAGVLAVFAVLIERATEREVLLKQVKVLRGLLPICSFCKKIRNDSGKWEPLEGYIARLSEAEFTHGICPLCAQEHYGPRPHRRRQG